MATIPPSVSSGWLLLGGGSTSSMHTIWCNKLSTFSLKLLFFFYDSVCFGLVIMNDVIKLHYGTCRIQGFRTWPTNSERGEDLCFGPFMFWFPLQPYQVGGLRSSIHLKFDSSRFFFRSSSSNYCVHREFAALQFYRTICKMWPFWTTMYEYNGGNTCTSKPPRTLQAADVCSDESTVEETIFPLFIVPWKLFERSCALRPELTFISMAHCVLNIFVTESLYRSRRSSLLLLQDTDTVTKRVKPIGDGWDDLWAGKFSQDWKLLQIGFFFCCSADGLISSNIYSILSAVSLLEHTGIHRPPPPPLHNTPAAAAPGYLLIFIGHTQAGVGVWGSTLQVKAAVNVLPRLLTRYRVHSRWIYNIYIQYNINNIHPHES